MGLMRHLRWIDDPYYSGFCIRKNSSAIMKEGGLFSAAVDLYKKVDPKLKISLKAQKLTFSSGASVSFSHYENDKAGDSWQGIECSGIGYDEAAQASESHIWWLISRLRTKAKMTPSIWLTCNPDINSFLRVWVDWWLYPEGHEKAGLPDPEKNGKRRFILRIGGELHWADSAEELKERFGENHSPLSIEAHLGTVYDNPWLLENQKSYVSLLEALPEIEKRRLLYGDWNARPKGSTYFQREWVEEVTSLPDLSTVEKTVRAFDFAGTLKSEINPSPDYTASVRMSRTKDKEYYIEDVVRTRVQFGDWKQFVLDCSKLDPPGTTYYITEDPNPMAKMANRMFVKELIECGLYVKSIRAGNTGKLDRFRPFSAMAQTGGVKVLKDCGRDLENNIQNSNDFFYKELEAFDGKRRRGEQGHDDLADSTADAFAGLVSAINIPSLNPLAFNAGLSNSNPLNK